MIWIILSAVGGLILGLYWGIQLGGEAVIQYVLKVIEQEQKKVHRYQKDCVR